MNNKKLYRSNTDKKVMGVCGGLGDYFEIDSTLVRLGFVALVLFAGTGLLAYLIMGIVIPTEDEINNSRNHSQNTDDKTENNIDETEDYYEQMSFFDDENL